MVQGSRRERRGWSLLALAVMTTHNIAQIDLLWVCTFISYHIISYFQSCRLIAYWLLLMAPLCVVSVCSVGVGEVFCSLLLVWTLLGGPHESGYIYLLPQSSPLAQCSTASTCTIQIRLCSVPLWTEDLWGALWHMNLPLFFFTSGSGGIRTRDLQRVTQALYQLSYLVFLFWTFQQYILFSYICFWIFVVHLLIQSVIHNTVNSSCLWEIFFAEIHYHLKITKTNIAANVVPV